MRKQRRGPWHQWRANGVWARMRHLRRPLATRAHLAHLAPFAMALVVAACSVLPGASPSAHELVLRQLAAHQAIWEQKGPKSYVITIERQCFCPGGQLEFTIKDGVVTAVLSETGLPVRPDQVPQQPKTVPELFSLVAGLPAEQAVAVSYDPDFGFPTQISVDPIPNAVDDEYTIVVHGFTPAS